MDIRVVSLSRFRALIFMALVLCLAAPIARSAPYAAFVIDARSGKVLHSRNGDTRLHPASLTKMMTLYIAFQAVERGEISLDTRVRISGNAAAEPPSKLGLRAGQTIPFRYLIRAAAVKSANDAATAIGEAISGSEAAFLRRMNATAKAMGMTRTTFRNAHGLTASGHLSTARDMTTLGRHVLYDYPEYYNLFSRQATDAGVRRVSNTNRRFLSAYRGADGIKTGYTRAAGFNLVASAERGNERIIATMFGGSSTAARNARVAELLDMGFSRAPSNARLRKPTKPSVVGGRQRHAVADPAIKASERPKMRSVAAVDTAPSPILRASALMAATAEAQNETRDASITQAVASASLAQVNEAESDTPTTTTAEMRSARPTMRPAAQVAAASAAVASAQPEDTATMVAAASAAPEPTVITRASSSGGGEVWGINIGRYPSEYKAERMLVTTALAEMATLDGSERKVVRSPSGFDANFVGMTRETADLACRRLKARNMTCFMVAPS